MITSPRSAGAAVLACCLLAGCDGDDGPPKVTQTGKLLKGGQPIQYDPMTERLEVLFYDAKKLEASKIVDPYDVDVREDGSFEVGEDRGGVPVGRYKLVMHMWTVDLKEHKDIDKFGDRFSLRNSRVFFDVTGDEEIIIDVDQLAAPANPN